MANEAKKKFKFSPLIKGLLFTVLCLFIWRIGVHIQLPFVEITKEFDSLSETNIFGFLDIFSGGALSQFSVLALGISPYITSSIVVQLLAMDIIPAFKEWSEEGETGKAKLNQWTRYIALFLAFVQALALVIALEVTYSGQLFQYVPNLEYNAFIFVYIALVLTAGTAFTLWLADQITMRGIGNGSSLMIVAGIIAGFPSMFVSLYNQYLGESVSNAPTVGNILTFVFIVLLFLAIIVAVVWMEGLQRKIPIQYANRPAASKMRGKQDSDIPLKLNSASVIPVIFASTLMSLPMTILNFVEGESIWWEMVFSYEKPIGFALYIVLIFVFSFFYSFLQIDPDKMSDNLKKQNAYILGVKPGEETAAFISSVLFKITLLGATYLAVLAALPIVIAQIFDLSASVQIGGTSLMIVVGVAIETVQQLKTESQAQEYHGFMAD